MAENSLTIRLGMTGAASVLGGLGSVQARVSAMSSAITTSTSRIAAGLAAITGGAGIAGSLGLIVKKGFAFNSTLEDAKLGIAAVQKTFDPVRFRDFGSAMEVSGLAIEALKVKALDTKASFADLVQGLQNITGVATQAGMSMRQQIDLTTLMAQALGGLGIETEQLNQETRALISGTIDKNARVAKMLNISAEDIQRATQSGKLFEFLVDKMKDFGTAGKIAQGNMSSLWSNLKDGLSQFSGAVTLPIFDLAKQLLKDLLTIDWEGAGKRASGFVYATIDAWNEGRIGELVSLTLQAGFEEGSALGSKALSSIGDFLTGPKISAQIGAMSASLVFGIAKGLNNAMSLIVGFLQGTFVYAAAAIGDLFVGVWNVAKEGAAGVVNFFIDGINKGLKLIGRAPLTITSLPPVTPKIGLTFDQALADGFKSAEDGASGINAMIQVAHESYLALIGSGEELTTETGKTVNAWGKVNEFMDKALAKRGIIAAGSAPLPGAPGFIGPMAGVNSPLDVKPPQQFHFNLLKAELDLKREMAALDEAQFNVQNNWALTSAEKRREGIKLLNVENEILKANIEFLTVNLAKTTDQKGRDEITGAIEGLQNKLSQNGRQRVSLGPDPDNFADTWISEFKRVQDSIGTMSQQIARTVSGTIGASLQTVSGYMNKMIWQGGSLKEMWLQVQQVISGKVLDAIADMFQEWIAGILARSAVEKTTAVADAAAKAPSAMLSSILSYGAAAVIGAAAMAAAMGAFQGGGYTGDGPPGQVAGLVHKGELVIPAPVTSRLDQSERAAMLRGNLPSRQQSGGGATSIRNDNRMTIAGVFNSETAAVNALNSTGGQTALMDFNRRNGFRFNRS